MKWKNIDIGAGCYYITATFTEWLPLFTRPEIRELVCEEITNALAECGGSVAAFVIMPDHLHLLVYLPDKDLLHRFCKLWRGRSGRKIPRILEAQGDADSLSVMTKHANAVSSYAVWKEQVRALAVWSEPKLAAMLNYIHANPVRRRLVTNPEDWEFSSYRFYESGVPGMLDVEPLSA
jgi:putative transposase